MEYRQGVSSHRIEKDLRISHSTILRLVRRYELYGTDGLRDVKPIHIPSEIKIRAVEEYLAKKLSLKQVLYKYATTYSQFKDWRARYERYRSGDKFAFNGGRIYSNDGMPERTVIAAKPRMVMKSKEIEERKKALGEMTKEELCELLLDARAEAELLKKLHALVEAKKARLRGTPRKSSKD